MASGWEATNRPAPRPCRGDLRVRARHFIPRLTGQSADGKRQGGGRCEIAANDERPALSIKLPPSPCSPSEDQQAGNGEAPKDNGGHYDREQDKADGVNKKQPARPVESLPSASIALPNRATNGREKKDIWRPKAASAVSQPRDRGNTSLERRQTVTGIARQWGRNLAGVRRSSHCDSPVDPLIIPRLIASQTQGRRYNQTRFGKGG